MALPDSKKHPHGWWKARRRAQDQAASEEAGDQVDQTDQVDEADEGLLRDQLVFCPHCQIGNILPHDTDPSGQDCVVCHERLVLPEDKRPKASKVAAMFEPLSGIRYRYRDRMAFRRVRSLFEIEVDPNRDLKGDRLREAMQEWLEQEHTSWDFHKRSRRSLWDDRPWMLLAILGIAAAAIAGGIFLTATLKERRDAALVDGSKKLNAQETLRAALPAEKQLARPVVEAFFKAGSINELIPLVRDRQRVTPLIINYYRDRHFEPVEPENITVVDAADFGGRKFLRVAVELPNADTYGLTLDETGDGYLVDWESFVGHSEVDWAEFKAAAPFSNKPVKLRAYATFTEQYLAPFDDAKTYQSILLRGLGGESLVGYIDRLDQACIGLRAKAAEVGKNHYEVIVSVRYPEEGWTVNEVEIVEILQTGWVEWDRKPRLNEGEEKEGITRIEGR